MDPSYVSFPSKSGYFRASKRAKLYYEIRTAFKSPFKPTSRATGHSEAAIDSGKVIMLMGAFGGCLLLMIEIFTYRCHAAAATPYHQEPARYALKARCAIAGTHQHFHEQADMLAANGYEVLLMDHRGVGKSGPCRLEAHTTSLLAGDALALVDHVWGPDAVVHVYGASMGGMVAQELALLLIKQRRLASLYLAVTCAGRMLLANRLPFQLGRLLLNLYIVRLLVPLVFGWPKKLVVLRLLQKCFRAECLNALHPSGATYRELYHREYIKNFRDLWAFGDHNVCAGHVHALASHHLSARKAAAINAAGVRVTVQVATHDKLVPPHLQLELATVLNAHVAAFHTGHVGWHMHKDEIFATLRAHLAGGCGSGLRFMP